MKNNPENIQWLLLEKTPEYLWEEFEKTGTIEAYLQYLQTSKNTRKPEFLQVPS